MRIAQPPPAVGLFIEEAAPRIEMVLQQSVCTCLPLPVRAIRNDGLQTFWSAQMTTWRRCNLPPGSKNRNIATLVGHPFSDGQDNQVELEDRLQAAFFRWSDPHLSYLFMARLRHLTGSHDVRFREVRKSLPGQKRCEWPNRDIGPDPLL